MKAMAVTQFGKPLEMIDLVDRVPDYGELILSVKACAIFASDLKLIAGRSPKDMKVDLPAIPGHEIVGSVAAIGPGVADWQIGDRGVVYVYVGCGQCSQCLSGNERRCRSLRYHIGLGVHGGFAEILEDKILILADIFEEGVSIDRARAEAAAERAKDRLRKREDDVDTDRAEAALARALARIQAHEKKLL